MNNYEYQFVVTVADGGKYILADKTGGSYYFPEQMKKAMPKNVSMGDVLQIIAEYPLEMTELAGTDSILCRGTVRIKKTESLLKTGEIAEFFISGTAYHSVLLTNTETGKDYLLFTSYVQEGYATPGIAWNTVTEGNYVKFLLFEGMPVMPAPQKKKWKIVKSYGASRGASMNSAPLS